jgi:2,5-diketo-D-gluconate reductase A
MPSPVLTMNDGRSIPQLGLGVYKIPDAAAAEVVETAIALGYRHIDTATLYENERGVGAGVRASGIPREDIFVTTKVWNSDHGFDKTLHALDVSLDKLGFDYVDLYLIHWPEPTRGLFVETWRALEHLQRDGKARSIGVSNFHGSQIDAILADGGIVPAVNQIELHPLLQQWETRVYDAMHNILTEAWSPLARGKLLDNPKLTSIASKHGKSVAQVVIRWHLQLGNVVIPKSVRPERIDENFDVFDFELGQADMDAFTDLEAGLGTGSRSNHSA